jgi:4-diphosphocytidyl-2-C-methyl-D-erythritol kinase
VSEAARSETTGQAGTRGAPSRAVSVIAPAKINLFLHAGDKRPDNYHTLESLVVFAEIGDKLGFAPSGSLGLKLSGPFGAQTPKTGDNLILKAANALQAVAPHVPGVAIHLEKNLPVAAGIGGGSADAAATLRGLNLFWDLKLPEARLLEIAAAIGSDVPACLLSRPCWMEGRGEHVKRTPALPQIAAILVNPGVQLSTKDVFGALNIRTGPGRMQPPPASIQTVWDLVGYLADAENDLEAPACRLRPVIDEVLDALAEEPGCVLSQMSGSGATCFGLFDGAQFAHGAAERIAQDHPHWWVKETRIAGPDIGTARWTS